MCAISVHRSLKAVTDQWLHSAMWQTGGGDMGCCHHSASTASSYLSVRNLMGVAGLGGGGLEKVEWVCLLATTATEASTSSQFTLGAAEAEAASTCVQCLLLLLRLLLMPPLQCFAFFWEATGVPALRQQPTNRPCKPLWSGTELPFTHHAI